MNVRSPGKGKGLLVAVETTVNLLRVKWMWPTVLLNQHAKGLLLIRVTRASISNTLHVELVEGHHQADTENYYQQQE